MPILWPDLPCQMLAQRLLAVRPEIIVEIPEPRFQHPNGNPDLKCSGAQPLCRALPGRIAVDGDVEALHPLRQQDRPEVTRRERRPDGKAGHGLDQGQHGLDAFADHEDVVMRGQPDGIAEEVTHGTPLRLDSRLSLSVRRQPGAMHALQGPCPIGDRSDQRRSGDAPGLALIPMPALRVEAQGAHHAALGQAPGAEVGVGKRACDRHRGCKQARRRRWCATGGLGLLRHWRIREDRLRTAKMRPGLGQKIGKAGDPGPLADDVEKITMLARGAIGELAGAPGPDVGPVSRTKSDRPGLFCRSPTIQ